MSDPFSTESLEAFMVNADLNKCLDYIRLLHESHREQMFAKDNVISLIKTSIADQDSTSLLQQRLIESEGICATLNKDFIELQAKYSGQSVEISKLTTENYRLKRQIDELRLVEEKLKRKTDDLATSSDRSSDRSGCCGLASASASRVLSPFTSACSRATSALYGQEGEHRSCCFNLRFA